MVDNAFVHPHNGQNGDNVRNFFWKIQADGHFFYKLTDERWKVKTADEDENENEAEDNVAHRWHRFDRIIPDLVISTEWKEIPPHFFAPLGIFS